MGALKIQEVSRHVLRSGKSKLTQKDTMGSNRISPYGKLVLGPTFGTVQGVLYAIPF
jgi:hypothetical protein